MVTPRFRFAGFVSRLVLNAFGFAAIVSPWRTVYLLPDYDTPELRRHETAHLAQMDRDGWLVFWICCVGWFLYPGYEHSPYEIEAREVENDPDHPLLKGYATC